jgi:hypothetical protein
MLADALASRIGALVPALDKRVEEVADLSELIRRKALPNAPLVAYVIPLGLSPRNSGESSAGAFTQMIDDVFGVVLVLQAQNDVTGGKSLPRLDVMITALLEAVCGWAPEDAVGDFRLTRGRLLSLDAGTIFYQLDFAIQFQLRVLA